MNVTQALYAILGGAGFAILGGALMFQFSGGSNGGGGGGGLNVPTPPTDDTEIEPPEGGEDEDLAKQRKQYEHLLPEHQKSKVAELA